MKKCPYCAEKVLSEAIKCKFCGEFFDKAKIPTAKTYKNPALALLLSFLLPGAGQMYNEQIGKGLGILLVFLLLIWTWVVPIVLWLISWADAYDTAKKNNLSLSLIDKPETIDRSH